MFMGRAGVANLNVIQKVEYVKWVCYAFVFGLHDILFGCAACMGVLVLNIHGSMQSLFLSL